ncbi:MAG: NAD-dependent epimerase/dehydratase family protein [Planctomycetota bacterium]|nr:NAD-dependent epimerase/dehydratase family protein [Planctomycetota bacterium]
MFALVTGGGGFLGRYIVEQLIARGDRVRSFSRSSSIELELLGVEQVAGTLHDSEAVGAACQGVDTVFHVAALAGIWGPWKKFHATNVLGTEAVLAGCQTHGVQRLIYTSSPSVTFDGSDQCNADESAPYPTHWLAHYPKSKAIAEQAVLAANEPGSLLTCALRPHLIWGPRDGHLVPRLLERQRSKQLRRVGDGTNLIDMIYVENAAMAHLQAADALAGSSDGAISPVAGRAYFLSQGTAVNCWNWINELLALAGLPPVKRGISLAAAWRIGAAMETAYRALNIQREPRMTRFLASQLGKSHYFDISAARRDFGYSPRVSTEEGMRRLKEWLRAESR